MLVAERHNEIVRLLSQQSTVTIQQLVTRLVISESTIRRDLAFLEGQGLLRRTFGGAVAVTGPESAALDTLSATKMRIGEAAARLVRQHETIFLGPGTTTMAVAHHLARRASGTVVTNDLNIAAYLARHSQLSVILTGGQIEQNSTALVGYLAEATLRELHADRAIIGVHGIHLPDGILGSTLACVQLMRAVIDIVPEIVVVADASKWGNSGPALVASFEAVDVIVTDQDAPPAMIWDLAQFGVQVIQSQVQRS